MNKRDVLLGKLDGRRAPVPVWLKDVFQGRAWMTWWCKRLERLLYELEQQKKPSVEWTQYLEVHETCNQLKQMLIDIHRKMPFCRCPKKDNDPNCPVCEGKGWINALQLTEHQIGLRK